MKRSHLVIFASIFGLIIANFVISALMWGKLPGQIPTHFGITGAPDAWNDKNIFYLFFVPGMQLLLFGLFSFIYKNPQYSSWPTTLVLMTVEEKKREKVFDVLRSLQVSTLFAISIFFSYLQFVIMATANGRTEGLSAIYAILFVGIIFLTIIIYSIRMFKVIKKITKS